MDNIEHETQVADPDILQEILKLLGWLPEMDVKKVRRTGHIGEYEICLDQVEELGDFVELEKLTGDDVDPEIVREELFKALEELGLSREDEETRGYDTQIYHLHKKTLS